MMGSKNLAIIVDRGQIDYMGSKRKKYQNWYAKFLYLVGGRVRRRELMLGDMAFRYKRGMKFFIGVPENVKMLHRKLKKTDFKLQDM